jgi:hypothetical protein
MSTNGIKPKTRATTKQFSEHAKRYVFFPLSNLNLASSQWMSPVWNPKIPRARFVLLESFEYKTQVVDENEQLIGSNGIQLGERTMGTDAQARFLMGNSDGTGYMSKGMVTLESLTDVDPDTAQEIEILLLPSDEEGKITIPDTLLGLKSHLDSLKLGSGENPVDALAAQTLLELKQSVNTAIRFCQDMIAELEKELADGLAGRAGIRTIDTANAYYYSQIDKPLPSEKATASNAGLVELLAQALNQGGAGTAPQNKAKAKEAELEAKANKELIARLEKENRELTETVNTLTAE